MKKISDTEADITTANACRLNMAYVSLHCLYNRVIHSVPESCKIGSIIAVIPSRSLHFTLSLIAFTVPLKI